MKDTEHASQEESSLLLRWPRSLVDPLPAEHRGWLTTLEKCDAERLGTELQEVLGIQVRSQNAHHGGATRCAVPAAEDDGAAGGGDDTRG